MEVLKNKFLVKLIASICLVVTLLSFSTSSKVYAADSDDKLWGGVLLTPIIQLLTATGDLVMNILHESVQDQDIVIFEINGHQEWWEKVAGLLSIAWGIFVAAVIISVVVLATGGIAAGAAALAVGTATAAKSAFVFAVAAAAGGAIIAGTTGGVGAGLAIKEKMIPENIELPAFSITAEQIFRNELLLFDVNFFNPMDDKTITTDKKVDNFQMLLRENINWILEEEGKQNYTNIDIKMSNMKNAFNSYIKLPLDSLEIYSDSLEDEADPNAIYTDYIKDRIKKKELYQKLASEENWQNMYIWLSQDNKLYKLESVEVFGMNNNKINLYSAQIDQKTINSIKDSIDGYETKTIKSTAAQLQGIVSKWYVMLRNVALLVLMLLLIYSGIRIVIGSTAGEKAKYKERLMDWLVGICLIFVMHYIMVFATEMVERVTNLIGKTVNGNMVYLELSQVQMDNAKEVLAGFDTTSAEDGIANVFDDNYKGNAAGALVWPTDLAGLFRIQAQLTGAGTNAWAGYSLCYLVLVLFTLFFAFTYLKRVLYMAFLTIIAPLVAMTYPLDKITDGKAQAFDAWLKEYIFNLMIQPLHLLLYTILVSSAFALASESPIYALVAIGFMMPAEKLMRRFFGFEKAKTPGLLGGAAGAAIAMTGLQSILKPKRHGGKSSGAGEGSKDSNNVKFVNKNNVNAMDAIAGEGMPLTENPVEKAARAAALENKAKKVEVQAANEATRLKIRENAKEASRLKQEQEAKIREAVEQTKRDKAKRIKGVAKVLAVGAGKQVLAGTLRGIRPDRLAGKLVGGTAAATSGLLLGVASGDPTKAFQYTTGGAVAGSALAESFADNKLLDGKELLDEAEMAYWGDDYKEHIIEKQKEEFQNNSANIAYIRKTTGASEKEAEDILETTGGYCFDHGITNVEDITAIHQLITGDNHISLEKALAAREYAHKRLPSDTDKMTAKAIKEHKDRWAQEYKERFTHLSDAQAHALADESFNLAIRFNKTKSGLTKL